MAAPRQGRSDGRHRLERAVTAVQASMRREALRSAARSRGSKRKGWARMGWAETPGVVTPYWGVTGMMVTTRVADSGLEAPG